ncbi:hypothetical protein [Nostoc sp. WHI]|uniref:hypothetical protein n=1 Tax=Nostoc sp. WHI TaxID=2650611 RepID=UPI0018C846FF|nr:hypothetical protein [Nostoc sp. WHI]MBG1268325.1 hypothetical protein [Nostoc sp. WHI]MBG1268572.1 hypothetical protein [Nostoc sp. WHI]
MPITIEQLKISLLHSLIEDTQVHLPYAREHNQQYPAVLQQCLNTVQALIILENLSQTDIEVVSIPDGSLITDVVFLVANQNYQQHKP